MYKCMHVCVCIHLCVHAFVFLPVCACVHEHACVHMCACVHVCMFVFACACVCLERQGDQERGKEAEVRVMPRLTKGQAFGERSTCLGTLTHFLVESEAVEGRGLSCLG